MDHQKQLLLFPTTSGVRQRVSVHTHSHQNDTPRQPIKPIQISAPPAAAALASQRAAAFPSKLPRRTAAEHPTPKPSEQPTPKPSLYSLLDLHIDGRGPSQPAPSQEEEDDDENPRTTDNISNSNNIDDDDDDDDDDDNDDDALSIQYTGSSCDDHSRNDHPLSDQDQGRPEPRPEPAPAPYMHSQPAGSAASLATSTAPTPLATKKSFHFFRLPHPRAPSHQQQQVYPNGSVDPSPVSSLASLGTSGSRASSKTSAGAGRMARLFSRVLPSSASTPALVGPSKARPQIAKSISTQHVPLPSSTATARPMRRKGSISNFLDTISISRDRAAKPLPPSDPPPPIAPRKSFDMLMRPFLPAAKPRTDPSSDPPPLLVSQPAPPVSRPLLKAKRSYDMLRGRLGSGRKSMDDLSNIAPTEPAPPAIPGPQTTKKLVASPSLLSDTPPPQPDPAPSRKLAPAPAGPPPRTSSSALALDRAVPPAPAKPAPSVPRAIDGAAAAAEWAALEAILANLQSLPRPKSGQQAESARADLTAALTGHLLPFLKRQERFVGAVYLDPGLATAHRTILLGWLELIFDELREPLPTSRAACLDGVSGILESHFFASQNLNASPEAAKQYRSVLVSVLNFAIDKLNDKAVYANTLVFAGRMLSLAFFRIEGVGRKLLRALPPVKRMSMRRLLDEMDHPPRPPGEPGLVEPPNLQPFPAYLRELCFVDLASYCQVFANPSLDSDNLLVQEGDIQVEMSGNWLIRWTASDSDLPFAFYRAYHRQLATYLRPQARPVVHPSTLISMPGFLLVSASFLDKCDSLVHRSLRSVTTLGPTTSSFNAGESANLAMGAKPKVLELAHRRLVSTALDIVGGSPRPPPSPQEQQQEEEQEGGLDDSARRRQFFGGLLSLWIRAITKRTSMWDTRSVFLLLDFLDGLFYTVLYTAPAPPLLLNELPSPPVLVHPSLALFDLPFILDVLRRILLTADNTVCVMRTIAFIYSQFEALTTQPETLKALCLDLLLDPLVFQHLFLHWNSGVRGYYMRLLVWRLSRLNAAAAGPRTPKARDVVKIILAFNARLDAIRKRHDQLSPVSEFLGSQEEEDRRRRRTTICSTRGVSDKPWAISELPPEEVCAETVDFRDPTTGLLSAGGPGAEKPSVAKVVSWLKVVKRLGGSSKAKTRPDYPSPAGPEPAGRQPMGEPRQGSPVRSLSKPCDAAPGPAQVELSELENESVGRGSESSVRSAPASHHGPESPTFFQFEFELGADIPRSDSFDTPATTPTASESPATPLAKSSDSAAPPTAPTTPSKAAEPRVSSRFSKRASLLPPAALDMLKDNDGSDEGSPVPAVPAVPAEYALPIPPLAPAEDDDAGRRRRRRKEREDRDARLLCYPPQKHPYAVKALAEYEQSLEEEFEWIEKLVDDHALAFPDLVPPTPAAPGPATPGPAGLARAAAVDAVVPRLAVSWPLSFSEDE